MTSIPTEAAGTTPAGTVPAAATGAPAAVAPDGPTGTGSRATRILGALILAGIALFVVLAFTAPEDAVQGDLVRMFFVHVPVAILCFLACFITTLGSAVYLWKRSIWWDTIAYAAAEIALVFVALTLVTGSLWGRPAWGTFWEWDPRLTSTAMLGLLILGYLALRKAPGSLASQAKRSAIVGLLLAPNVIIVRQSVDWWRSLHQAATIDPLGGTHMQGAQLFAFFAGMLVFAGILAWLLIHRFRVAWLERQVEELDLDEAIAARRAEAGR